MAAVVGVDLASGASNIYSLIAGSFITWQGTCIFYIISYFRIWDPLIYLLSVFCVLDFSCASPLCQSYRGKVLRLRILVFVPGSWLEAPEWATS